MRKRMLPAATTLLTATLLTPTWVTCSSADAAGHKAPAAPIVKRMVATLLRQGHVQAQGSSKGPGKLFSSYQLRFQSPDKEEVTMGAGAGRKRQSTVRSVYVGRTAFTAAGSGRWVRLQAQTTPSPLDALSISTQGASCCGPAGPRPGERISYGGTGTFHGTRVYIIRYRGFLATAEASGTVLVDARTYLPLQYTVNTLPTKTSGLFTLKYDGSFSISAPSK